MHYECKMMILYPLRPTFRFQAEQWMMHRDRNNMRDAIFTRLLLENG